MAHFGVGPSPPTGMPTSVKIRGGFMAEEQKEKGFVIKDRRHFDESGAVRSEEAPKEEEKIPEAGAEAPETSSGGKTAPEPDERAFPEMNFASFIFSLSTTAMYHFGDFPDPVTKEARRNLPAAKQTIDILSILKMKTEGNLDEDEKQLLDDILYELRMRFVKETTKK
jgi:hypothetical protein